MVKKKEKRKKPAPERAEALKSLPPNVRQSLTEEEVELFLYEETWPEELFDKLKDFIYKEE